MRASDEHAVEIPHAEIATAAAREHEHGGHGCGCGHEQESMHEPAAAGMQGQDGGHRHGHGESHDHDYGHQHVHDHGHGHTHDHHAHGAADACCGATPVASPRPAAAPPAGSQRVRYRIDKMDCPTEERLIRNKLEPMPGVARLDFNLLERELTVYHCLPDATPLADALHALDMAPNQLEEGQIGTALPPAVPARLKWLLALGGVAALAAEGFAWSGFSEHGITVGVLAAASIFSTGLPTLKKGWIAIRHLTLNIYFLMSLAVAGALVIGKWPEAAMVIFLFALAEAIEALSLERARNAIRGLTALAPETAEVADADSWSTRPVNSVAVGERIRIRTGERVPLDAVVESGQAWLDQAPITGESMPQEKRPGAALYAGSIVTDGVIQAVVSAPASHSTLARIAGAIQAAQSQRAPTQRFVDNFARYYTPLVVLFALAVAVLGPMLFAGPWSAWLYEALVLLVIACPCALVVSTPVTVVSGLAAAARQGILIKGGAYLEAGRLLKAVALDKTGTLTVGKPTLNQTVTLANLSAQEALKIAASLDDHSTHPIARAIVGAWRESEQASQLYVVEDFTVQPGSGVSGSIDGQMWSLGKPGADVPAVALEQAGQTQVVLRNKQGPVALFALADAIRDESREAIAQLRALDVHAVMLTGDNEATAQAVAAQLGVTDIKAGLLPEDKQKAITELKARWGAVGMVGDGINDAPALAQSSIGLAMGAAGTATAIETADVAIMDDDPRKIAGFIRLSHQAARVLKQNIVLALAIKLVFLGLALTGQATLWMAVFADMGASLLVVFNGLRLLSFKR